MYTLPVSQCPKCELRFGSPSERDLHLREDHRRRPQRPLSAAAPAAAPVASQPAQASQPSSPSGRDVRLHASVVRGVIAAALLAVVSALSWQVAMVLTLFLLAGVAGWALRQAEP